MKIAMTRIMLAVALMGLAAGQASAGLVYFTSQSSFNAATAALATQTFASANVGAGGINVTNSPLNAATNDGVFSTGNILPGLSITASGGSQIAVTGVGFHAYANKAVFGNLFQSILSLNFAPAVTAASANLLSYDSGGTIGVSVFSPASALIGTTSVLGVPASGAGLFFGVIATGADQIGSISFTPGVLTVGVDQVQFGRALAPVPEPTTLASAGVAAVAGLFMARRKRRTV